MIRSRRSPDRKRYRLGFARCSGSDAREAVGKPKTSGSGGSIVARPVKIRDLLRLTQGSVVELDRIAGEPLDLLVNNTVVAQGEVVLVNDRYGIRLTRVVPASERLDNL